VTAREHRRRQAARFAGIVGLAATAILLGSEPSYRVAQGLCAAALAGLVGFDLVCDGKLAKFGSPFVPVLALVAVAETFWLHGEGMTPDVGHIGVGVVIGALTALLAVGLALVYRANRVVNFAQGDLGVVPALFAIFLIIDDSPGGMPDWMTGLPYVPSFAVGLLAAAIVGFLVERLVVNRFSRAPRLVLTVATIGVAQVLTGLALFMPGWFGFEGAPQVPDLRPPFDAHLTLGGHVFDSADVLVVVAAPVILVALAGFLRFTRVGIAVRAASERSDRAAMLGVPVGRIQMTVWMITTALAFVTVFLRAGVTDFPIGSALGVLVLVRALAATVIGRMDEFPRIASAAIGLGIAENAVNVETGRDLYAYPVMFVIILAALAVNRRRRGSRVDDQAVSSWDAAREMRPTPPELRRLPEVWGTQWALLAAVALFLLSLPVWMSNSDVFIATSTAIVAIIAVSLVVLTGWAGHVSLGQLGFAAIGGAVGGWITQTAGWDLAFGLLGGGLVGAAAAVAVGLPAARAGGLALGVTTLAMAAATLYWVLNREFFPWVPRRFFSDDPLLLNSVEISTPVDYYYLTLGVLGLVVAMAYGLRRTRTGRVIIGLRENPRAAEAYGVRPVRTTLVALAFAGFMAAIAGVLFVHNQGQIIAEFRGNPFAPEESIRVFATVVIGGLASVPGAILGAVYVYTVDYYLPQQWSFLATGAGLLVILYILPGGLGAGLADARDGLLRWRAKKRGILVPSLVADRRVDTADFTPEMTAAIADAVERPELEEVSEMHQ
jgi:branched-chain amino acid transport system permease protein